MLTESILNKFRIRVSGEDDNGAQGDPETKPEGESGTDDHENHENNNEEDSFSIDDLPASAQKYIKDLRSENAKRRKDFNNMSTRMERFEKGFKSMFGEEEDDIDPETKLDALSGHYESAISENAILRLAVENGISGGENIEYFEFLMNKSLDSLDEGEEMTEEMLNDVISKIQAKGKANTSFQKSESGNSPRKGNAEVSQEEFDRMGMVQKSNLYLKNPELYNKLMQNSAMG